MKMSVHSHFKGGQAETITEALVLHIHTVLKAKSGRRGWEYDLCTTMMNWADPYFDCNPIIDGARESIKTKRKEVHLLLYAYA